MKRSRRSCLVLDERQGLLGTAADGLRHPRPHRLRGSLPLEVQPVVAANLEDLRHEPHTRGVALAEVAVHAGVQMRQGDKVAMWYLSANRDETAFPDPYRFDITRDPNDHGGFGTGGAHFCLGAHLARREITVMLTELLRRLPDIAATDRPEKLRSNFIRGIKRLPVAFTPAR
jgi:cytochrome P450